MPGWLLVSIVCMEVYSVGLQAAELSAADMHRLQQGETLLEVIHTELPGGAAKVTALFHTDSDTIWNVIGHCRYEFVYLKGLKLCEVLKTGNFLTTVHHRVRNSWYSPTLDFTFEAKREPCCHGEFELVDGNLKVLVGQWNFEPMTDDDSYIVSHEIRIQPRVPAPRWLIRRSLKKDLPNMLSCIRGLAQASGNERRLALDLQRCPGKFNRGEISPADK